MTELEQLQMQKEELERQLADEEHKMVQLRFAQGEWDHLALLFSQHKDRDEFIAALRRASVERGVGVFNQVADVVASLPQKDEPI